MQEYPHIYKAGASAGTEGEVKVTSPNLDALQTTSPPEFGGPEGTWSPETLLVASVADCFILTFRAVARASRFEWHGLECAAEGKLEKVDRLSRFTEFRLRAKLRVPADANTEKAERLLHKAEAGCLITNSLKADIHLDVVIETVPDRRAA
ncbi:MAG: OsmC family peroxiredoxin [Xanthomonadales bacterium]|nr:OsmC family peroxiredoxin [Xanthomonadales bacterium]NIX13663.1 OsmC family peroxiredoxin [Xanthomonadales bacterium]